MVSDPSTDASGLAMLVGRAVGEGGGGALPLPLQLVLLMTMLTVLPSMLLMMTCFTRFIIVLSILRQAIGLNQSPPNQVLVGLALFMTWFAMQPVFDRLDRVAVAPYAQGRMSFEVALAQGGQVMHSHLLAHTRKSDIAQFARIAGVKVTTPQKLPFRILLPAYAASELKTAFQIGVLIFLPFVVIDLLVATILTGLGMMMMSPVIVALPFKLLLFVLVDGWSLLLGSLATGARVAG